MKYRNREIQLAAFFEKQTGSLPKDCLYNEETHRITFVTNPGEQTERAVVRSGEIIRGLRADVVEFSKKIDQFVINCLFPSRISKVMVAGQSNRKIIHVIVPSSNDKSRAIGKHGWKIKRARLLLKRHFDVNDIRVRVQRSKIETT